MEILSRFYLEIGASSALVGLALLGVTSTDRALRTRSAMAGSGCTASIYALGVLALLHYFLQSKADVTEATADGRAVPVDDGVGACCHPGRTGQPLPVLALGCGAALLSLAVEYGWYSL